MRKILEEEEKVDEQVKPFSVTKSSDAFDMYLEDITG